ncbi:MAG: hypothetical protein ACRELV_17475 [Longimicrobiales bacterium]
MRQHAPLPQPDPDRTGAVTLHELVRDYPELLGALRARGIDVRGRGADPVASVEAADTVLALIGEATRWRPDPT